MNVVPTKVISPTEYAEMRHKYSWRQWANIYADTLKKASEMGGATGAVAYIDGVMYVLGGN